MDTLSHVRYDQTLREELRKVQSSAAILGRQRGPGVGYWSPANNNSVANTPTSSETVGQDSPSNDEDVNVEYLRNVILQFLEHKEMRVRYSQPWSRMQADESFLAESGSGAVDHSTIYSARNS
jgi:hypothetical protein